MRLKTALLAFLLGSTAAQAASVNYTTTNAAFTNTVGGADVSASSSGNDATLRWGVDVGEGRSRYEWNGFDGVININPGDVQAFTFGEFTHVNRPIGSGSGIDSTVLNFDLNILGVTETISLNIDHTETPNTGDGCCDDRVSISNTIIREIIEGDLVSTFSISPFVFFTKEDASTPKLFGASIAYRIAEVPIPPAALLFAGGLAGIGALARKRKQRI